jgi:hypothetical protein
MEADARTHSNDEVANGEGDDLDPVDRVRAEPEDGGHGAGQGQADQEGVVDPLLESGTARNHADGLGDSSGLAGSGEGQVERSKSLV